MTPINNLKLVWFENPLDLTGLPTIHSKHDHNNLFRSQKNVKEKNRPRGIL